MDNTGRMSRCFFLLSLALYTLPAESLANPPPEIITLSTDQSPGLLPPKLQWTYTLQNSLPDNAAAVVGPDATLYISSTQSLSAIHPDGTLSWQHTSEQESYAGVTLSEDGLTLYAARRDGVVVALTASTGVDIWTRSLANGGESFGTRLLLDGKGILYVMGNDTLSNTWVYAVSAAQGVLEWKYQLNQGDEYLVPHWSALTPNGSLYLLSSRDSGTENDPPRARLFALGESEAMTPITIDSVVPATGSVWTTVTLTGSGFTPDGNTVRFGPGYIKDLSSNDGTQLQFSVPEGLDPCAPGFACRAYVQVSPGDYAVSVINTQGTSNSVSFRVSAAP